jgi:hypothetical protein
MPEFSSCTAKLTFEYGRIDSRHMNLSVMHDAKSYMLEPVFDEDTGHAELIISITLPTNFYFLVSNKGAADTVVDDSGNILKDCYIKLTSISLDQIETNCDTLGQKIILTTTTGQTVKSNYFGFNGTAVLPLLKPDVFSQVLTLNLHSD